MTLLARQAAALLGAVVASATIVFVLTKPSRDRLVAASEVIEALKVDEADLFERMAILEAAKVGSDTIPAEMVWSGDDDSAVEIAQQQTLVDAASSSGLQVLSFGAAQGPDTVGLKPKAYEIEVAGGHVEIARFLASVEQAEPRMAISYLWIRQIPLNQGQTIAPVNLRLVAWGFVKTESVAP